VERLAVLVDEARCIVDAAGRAVFAAVGERFVAVLKVVLATAGGAAVGLHRVAAVRNEPRAAVVGSPGVLDRGVAVRGVRRCVVVAVVTRVVIHARGVVVRRGFVVRRVRGFVSAATLGGLQVVQGITAGTSLEREADEQEQSQAGRSAEKH
jgi:hypothetical protein